MKKVLTQRQPTAMQADLPADLHPVLRRIYLNRGIQRAEELHKSTAHLHNYQLLKNIDQATALLYQMLQQQKRIVVVGDFDTDGATSTALTVRALRNMGAASVEYIVPDRFNDGYGLSKSVVEHAISMQADLIITVDNGVSSLEGVSYAKQHNIAVIITDHHLPPTMLPPADVIINPNLVDCPFPSKNLAGVGVAFYFMAALRTYLRAQGWFEQQNLPEYNIANLLDLVALGTVADVVPLDSNNRILVYQGLNRIRKGYCCEGINALIKVANKNASRLQAQDLGFVLAPRLNAAGRMESMSLGIELLLCDNPQTAEALASELDNLNQDRRHVEQTMQLEAMSIVQRLEQQLQEIPNGIVLYHPEWHQGVIGILSARIKDKFYRPVISFADAGDGYLKGSGRSISGFHLRDALERIDSNHPGLIECFGGHAMAAGLTLKEQHLAEFKQHFEALSAQLIDDTLLNNIVLSDGTLANNEISCQTAKILQDGGPWGQGFSEPLFDGEFIIHQQRLVGEKHLKLLLEPASGGDLIDGIAFNIDTLIWPDLTIKRVQLAYHLDINEFRGKQTVQLLIRHLWPLSH